MKKGELKNGFTMIELSLVIAIAGLIFLMVFIALPWLRATQRDTKRREDLLSFIDEVKTYQQKNRGTLPGMSDDDKEDISVNWTDIPSDAEATTWAGFYRDYLRGSFMDPVGENYSLMVTNCGRDVAGRDCNIDTENMLYPNNYQITVIRTSTCSNGRPVQSSNPRKLAAIYVLETGGFYCANS